MSANPRQKACLPCASSKRRCDHELPECRRCRDKDIDCEYPQPKRRRREIRAGGSEAATPIFQGTVEQEGQGHGTWAGPNTGSDTGLTTGTTTDATAALEFGEWDPTTELDMSFINEICTNVPDLMTHPAPFISSLPALIPPSPGPESPLGGGRNIPSNNNGVTGCIPFFLRDETWPLHHSRREEMACTTTIEMEPFIGEVERMFQSWVRDGSNVFIHSRLYHRKMPSCVQDAFTTLAAYLSRSPATKDIILQAADDRAAALLKQPFHPSAVGGVVEIEAHLARVHALFVYVFIRLFDGSVRFRASAEAQIPALRHWQRQMWQMVKRNTWRDEIDSFRAVSVEIDKRQLVVAQRNLNHLDAHYEAISRIWHLWVLTESLRRTYLVVDVVLNTYQLMAKGWADCEGYAMVTVHRGLWDAESPMKWFVLSCNAKAPLVAPSLSPGPLMSQYSASEFDDFAKMCWSFVAGREKMQYWAESSA